MLTLGDVTGWRAYSALRGHHAPAQADDLVAQEALIRGRDYIAHHYVAHFLAPAPDAVLEAAIYEAASLELAEPGLFRASYTPGQTTVLTGVKGITWQVVGDASREGAMMPVSTMIEAMLGRYLGRKLGLGLRSVG